MTASRHPELDAAIDGIDQDLIAIRDRALGRAVGMLTGVDRELSRLQVLEDCLATLRSANDNAIALLRHAIDDTRGRLWAEQMADEVEHHLGGRHQ